ncbi:MAG: glycogen debranching enzyme N-terminal domain-containing protein [Anaerolineae bacterium]|nr:glycogen debranching enzyme N-terminal domain-containing protein [Anaerolineae bacterium]
MVVIPREICRNVDKVLSYEWMLSNHRDSYAAASIAGALTRTEHGLLVTRLADSAHPVVTLAKIDEEVEVGGQVYKLGTNEYKDNVISPDGFLYLQRVELDGNLAQFTFEAGRFQLTKAVWMAQNARTTYIRYTLAEQSEPMQLTLLPFCDYRSNLELTTGDPERRFQIQPLPSGFEVLANDNAVTYRILLEHDAVFTPLDLWYWRFRLRAAGGAQTDLFVPGLFRAGLKPGASLTMIATLDARAVAECDAASSFDSLSTRPKLPAFAPPDQFNSAVFVIGRTDDVSNN